MAINKSRADFELCGKRDMQAALAESLQLFEEAFAGSVQEKSIVPEVAVQYEED